MGPVELVKNLAWVGVVDWNVRNFHGYSTYKGTTYNAYLYTGEKNVLFDTVKTPFAAEFLSRVRQALPGGKLDFLVVNHVEMDHSGALPETIALLRPEKILCSSMAREALLAHFHRPEWPLEVVKSGEERTLGSLAVRFLETRMLHWPDSMFSYLPDQRVLISSDAFGQHWATSERFDDEVAPTELLRHAAKYYANIILPYSHLVQKLLTTVRELGIAVDLIAPDHGLIWRKNPAAILEAYQRWSSQRSPARALVIYDSMWLSTTSMAQAVTEGLAGEGVPYTVFDLSGTHHSDILTEVLDARALVFGSPTLNNGLLPTVAGMLAYLKGLRPLGKVGAAFGSYGWSGESVKLLNAELASMKVALAHPGIAVKYVPTAEDLTQCRELGRQVGRAAKEAAGRDA